VGDISPFSVVSPRGAGGRSRPGPTRPRWCAAGTGGVKDGTHRAASAGLGRPRARGRDTRRALVRNLGNANHLLAPLPGVSSPWPAPLAGRAHAPLARLAVAWGHRGPRGDAAGHLVRFAVGSGRG